MNHPAGHGSRPGSVLRREPEFRQVFASQVLSILGDRVTQVALPFAVLGIGGGVSGVALVTAAQFVPYLLLALPAGVWADRHDRLRIVIASDVVRMACQVVAAGLLFTGSATPALLAALAVGYGAAEAFFAPAMTGLVPSLVAPSNLQAANALRGLAFSAGCVAGPAVAALVLALGTGPAGALALDAATFAVSVGLLRGVHPGPVHAGPGSAPEAGVPVVRGLVSGLREGWREVRDRSWVRSFLLAILVYHLLVAPAVLVLGPVRMQRDLGGADSWALAMACFGVGAVVGNLVVLGWRPDHPMRTASLLVVGAACQPAILGSGLGTTGIAALMLLAGACIAGASTLWETSLAAHVPHHALSRVVSFDYLSSRGMLPLGSLLVAALGVGVGVQVVLVAATVLMVVVALGVAAVPGVRLLGSARAAPAADADGRVRADLAAAA